MRILKWGLICLLLLLYSAVVGCGTSDKDPADPPHFPGVSSLPLIADLDNLPEPVAPAGKSTSETIIDLALSLLQSPNVTYDDLKQSILLNPGPKEMSFVLYRVDPPSANHPLDGIEFELDPEVLPPYIWVGVADFSNNRWEISQHDQPGEQVYKRLPDSAYFSPQGYLYTFAATYDSGQASITNAEAQELIEWFYSVGNNPDETYAASTVDPSGNFYTAYNSPPLVDGSRNPTITSYTKEGELRWGFKYSAEVGASYRVTDLAYSNGQLCTLLEARPAGSTEPSVGMWLLDSQGELVQQYLISLEDHGFIPTSLKFKQGEGFISGHMGIVGNSTPYSFGMNSPNVQEYAIGAARRLGRKGVTATDALLLDDTTLLLPGVSTETLTTVSGRTGPDFHAWIANVAFDADSWLIENAREQVTDSGYSQLIDIWSDAPGQKYGVGTYEVGTPEDPSIDTVLYKFTEDNELQYVRIFGGDLIANGFSITGSANQVYIAGWTANYGEPVYDGMLLTVNPINAVLLDARNLGSDGNSTNTFLVDVNNTSEGLFFGGSSFSATTNAHPTHFWTDFKSSLITYSPANAPQFAPFEIEIFDIDPEALVFTDTAVSAQSIVGEAVFNTGGGGYDMFVGTRNH